MRSPPLSRQKCIVERGESGPKPIDRDRFWQSEISNSLNREKSLKDESDAVWMRQSKRKRLKYDFRIHWCQQEQIWSYETSVDKIV